MAVPKIHIHAMLACRSIQAKGPRESNSMVAPPYTLEGVSYTFQVEANQVKPFVFEEFWLYLRILRLNDAVGQRELGLKVFALDDDNNRVPVPYSAHSGDVEIPLNEVDEPYSIGVLNFPSHSPVISVRVRLQNMEFPDVGRYEFQLFVRRKKPDSEGNEWLLKANHFLAVER